MGKRQGNLPFPNRISKGINTARRPEPGLSRPSHRPIRRYHNNWQGPPPVPRVTASNGEEAQTVEPHHHRDNCGRPGADVALWPRREEDKSPYVGTIWPDAELQPWLGGLIWKDRGGREDAGNNENSPQETSRTSSELGREDIITGSLSEAP